MSGPHIGINQESSRKINEYENGTPEHETTGREIKQEDNSRYIPRGQLQ